MRNGASMRVGQLDLPSPLRRRTRCLTFNQSTISSSSKQTSMYNPTPTRYAIHDTSHRANCETCWMMSRSSSHHGSNSSATRCFSNGGIISTVGLRNTRGRRRFDACEERVFESGIECWLTRVDSMHALSATDMVARVPMIERGRKRAVYFQHLLTSMNLLNRL